MAMAKTLSSSRPGNGRPADWAPLPWAFDGGVAQADMANLDRRPTRGTPLLPATIPHCLQLPLCHVHAPLHRIVAEGARVFKGQLLATGPVDLHAPTSGRIVSVAPGPATHPSATPVPTIRLAADGLDTWHPDIASAPRKRSVPAGPAQLLASLRSAGIGGMGGAGFPLFAKVASALAGHPEARASKETAAPARHLQLLVNAVECEPGITSDEALLVHHTNEVIAGIELLCEVLEIQRCVIAIDGRNTVASAALAAALPRATAGLTIAPFIAPARFPAGSERQLFQALTGQRLAPGQRPVEHGWLCQSPATLHALYRAVALGQPCIERIVTITGPGITTPTHRWVRIGHPIGALVGASGRADDPARSHSRILHGGPVTGWQVGQDAAVTKQTFGLYCASGLPDTTPQPCINCGRCAQACPEQLQPQELLRFSELRPPDAAELAPLDACIECGACDLVCPSTLPLLATFRWARSERQLKQAARQRAAAARRRYERHEQRLQARRDAERARREARLASRRDIRRRWVDP